MPRVVPGLEVVRWLEDEPEGPRRDAVLRWLIDLAAVDRLPGGRHLPADDPSVAVEIPGTDLIAICIPMPVLDAIVIERIESVAAE